MSINVLENGQLKKIAGNAKDFDATIIPVKTTATENDTVVANIGSETSQITFKDMTEQVEFSGIAASNKTLVGGINELVSRLGYIPVLTCDFDDPPAQYIFAANPSSVNAPPDLVGNSWIVIQQYPRGSMFSTQFVFGFGSNKIAMRRKYNSTTWTDWEYFYPNGGGKVYTRNITSSDLMSYAVSVGNSSTFIRSGRTVTCTLGELKTTESYNSRWNDIVNIPIGFRPIGVVYNIGWGLYGETSVSLEASGSTIKFVKSSNNAATGAITFFTTFTWVTNDVFPE